MLNTILGFKQNMGAVYVANRRYPVTWVKVEPCLVTQIKHEEKDGYMAVQLATGSKKTKNISKPLQGHLKSINNKQETINKKQEVISPPSRKATEGQGNKQKTLPRYIREIRIKEDSGLKVGDEVKAGDVLHPGDIVTVTGTSKGKGFAGVVKRHGFAGGPKTHGQSDRERAPGSIGQRTTPGRIYKGKRMAGRMGTERVSVKNLTVIDIDEKNNLVAIKGAVPGATKGLVFIKKTGEGSVFVQNFDETKGVITEKVLQGEQVLQVEEVESIGTEDVAEVKEVNQAIEEKKEENIGEVKESGKVKLVEKEEDAAEAEKEVEKVEEEKKSEESK